MLMGAVLMLDRLNTGTMGEGEGVDTGGSSSYLWDLPRHQSDENLQTFAAGPSLPTALIRCFLCTMKGRRCIMRRWLRAGKVMLRVFSSSCVNNKLASPLDIH